VTLLLLGCARPHGAASPDALAAAVVQALAARDRGALAALQASTDAAVDACPALAEVADQIRQQLTAGVTSAAAFDACATTDWSAAEQTGGAFHNVVEGCDAFVALDDLVLTTTVAGQTRRLTIDDPVTIDGRAFLFGAVSCVSGTRLDIVRAAVERVCACGDAACGKAASDGLAAALEARKETPSAAEQAAVLTLAQRMATCMQRLR